MDKKLISEISRIHELMGTKNLITEQAITRIADDLLDFVKSWRSTGTNKVIRTASEFDNLSDDAKKFFDELESMVNSKKDDEILDLFNQNRNSDVSTYITRMENKIYDDIHTNTEDLKPWKDNLERYKTEEGFSDSTINEFIDEEIDARNWSQQKKDLYKRKLREELGITNKSTGTKLSDAEIAQRMDDITGSKSSGVADDVASIETRAETSFDQSKFYESIDAQFNEYQKIADDLVNATKNTDKPFVYPKRLKKVKNAEEFKSQLQTEIEVEVNKVLGDNRLKAKLEDYEKALNKLTKAEKQAAITRAVETAAKNTKSRFIKILESMFRAGRLPFAKYNQMKKWVGNNIKAIPVVGENLVNIYSKTVGRWWVKLILNLALTGSNMFTEYRVRKYYDEDMVLPTWYNTVPFVGGASDWVRWLTGMVFGGEALLYNIIAVTTNNIMYSDEMEDKPSFVLGAKITEFKDSGMLPEIQFSGDDETLEKFRKFLGKVTPTGSASTALTEFLSAKNISSALNFWENFTEDGLMDDFFGMPFNQIYLVKNKFYYVTENGRFEILDAEGDKPYIETLKDGKKENIYIKDIFLDKYPRFLEGYEVSREEDKVPLEIVKQNTIGSVFPDNKMLNPILDGKFEDTVGIYVPSSVKKTALTQVSDSDLRNKLNSRDILTFDFYKAMDVIPNEAKGEGWFKPKEGADRIDDFIYYNDNGTPLRIVLTQAREVNYEPNTYYILNKEGTEWTKLSDFLDERAPNNTTSTNESKTPKEQFETENPGIKLTLKASIGDLAVYEGDNNKRYKLSEGKIVEF